jgi:ribosome-associated translation inhibitor RaiA
LQKPLQITFKGTESSPAFEALIRQRVDALGRLHRRITGCRVVVEIPYRGADSAKVPVGVAVEVDVPGHNTIFGKDTKERHEAKADHTAPLNNAFDAVERQLDPRNTALWALCLCEAARFGGARHANGNDNRSRYR